MNKNPWLFLFFPIVVFVSCVSDDVRTITIAGSDTALEITQAQAEAFYNDKGIPVNVTGGGSGVGINLLREKSIDVANSSRELSKEETEGISLVQVAVANDLISIVTNRKNPIKNLSIKQLGDIYTGRIKNWAQLGWDDLPISLYGRQNSSGTYQFFQQVILQRENYSPRVKEMTGNSQLIRSLKEDIAGIAYVAYGYYLIEKDSLNVMSIDGIMPSLDHDMKKYVLKREIYEIFRGGEEGKMDLIRQWFAYILGPEGEKQAIEMGFLPLSKEQRQKSKQDVGIT